MIEAFFICPVEKIFGYISSVSDYFVCIPWHFYPILLFGLLVDKWTIGFMKLDTSKPVTVNCDLFSFYNFRFDAKAEFLELI